MNVESREPGDHIARNPKLWAALFVGANVTIGLFLVAVANRLGEWVDEVRSVFVSSSQW